MTSPAASEAINTNKTTPVQTSGVSAPLKSTQATVTSSGSSTQNAKKSRPATVNGKPALPLNGSTSEHTRKSSVTMAANGPSNYGANGGAPGIQFGYDSPAMAHSTPQAANSAPINIPSGNNRVPSPAASPSPIPQPSASGGRPPSGLQSGQMTFGSLGSDGDRHMRQGSVPPNTNPMGGQPNSHFRRESTHSIQGDNSATGAGRGNFLNQNGRGRGGFNPHNNYNGNQMGYPPNGQFRHGQGRGMPPNFQNQPRNMPYPNSPQTNHRSPAMVPSLPGTPNMPPASMQPNMNMQTPPQFHYPPPMAPAHQQNYGYPPQQLDQYGRPMQVPYGYNNMGYMAPPQNSSPGYNQQFVPPAYGHQPSHSMSRTPSQPERPSSTNPSNQPGTPQLQNAQPKVGGNNFVRPKKSAAIQIKNAAGETIDINSLKQPASPAPSSQAKTPPVANAIPTPPKASTPSHARSESQAPAKTAQEIQDELKAKIRQATQGSATEKAAEQPAATKPSEAAAPAAGDKAAPAEVPAEAPAEAEADSKKETEDEEMERMIREMEEEEAKREKKEQEHLLKREAEKAAAKSKDEADRKKNAAEEDRKLREAEREMERLEEEKERKRAEGSGLTVAEALSGKTKDVEPKVESVTEKLSGLKIGGEKATDKPAAATPAAAAAADKRGKPAALNLAPLNTKPVEPPQPSAALQSLKSARFLQIIEQDIYPAGIKSPNPALNAAVAKKGKTFKYDANFLLQFQKVFTEQPSLEFHQQVKSLIGDDGGRSASARAQTPRSGSRGGAGNFPMSGAIGSFNAPGRPLPSGTTSAERFAMSTGAMARPGATPMASFQRPGGAFPGGSMSRTSSQTNMGNLSNAPRQNSRSTRGSRRGGFDPKEAQAAKTMPLTAGMDIKPISVSAGGWKPISLTSKAASNPTGAYLDPEMVQRKVKAALNKMTPEKFDRIADQILEIASQSKDESDGRTLRQVIQLTFEKATDEAHWASMYAKFCKRMLETMSAEIRDEGIKDKNGVVVSGGALFRKYLLNRCQEEFERGWAGDNTEANEKEKEKEGEEADKAGAGEAKMMSDEYYVAAAAKRRGLGLVQFIGELYKLGMLTERIMHECVHKLVDYKGVPDEAEIESLSKLLRTIGANLDATEKGRPMMDAYFQRIQSMVELPELPSRLQFMLMDVIDLRRVNWVSKETNKGPKTLDEVRADAEAAQAAKAQEAARANQRGGGGGGRPTVGRGDSRNFSGGYNQPTSNHIAIDDLRRLKGSANRSLSGSVTLGPTSMFASRSNSGRRLGPGGSLGRPGEDSGASSRTGTPPTRDTSHSNAFSLLANMETENPASPPSASASPALAKATPADDKKDGE